METRASYTLVGVFVLLFVTALVVFAVWLARVEWDDDRDSYQILFTGAVTGLQEGSRVQVRGIPVGTVTDVGFNPDNLEEVRVIISIRPDAPIREDSIATLSFQGITGSTFIQIEGGSQAAPPLVAQPGELPIIPSRPSTLAELMDGAPELLGRLLELADQAQEFLTPENQQAFGEILTNVVSLTDSLATATDDLGGMTGQLEQTMVGLDGLIGDWRRESAAISEELQSALRAVDVQAAAISGEVEMTATEARQLINAFERTSDQLTLLIQENRGPINEFTSEGLYEFALLMSELRTLSVTLSRLVRDLQEGPGEFLLRGRGGREVQ